jgi:hypothetical protein
MAKSLVINTLGGRKKFIYLPCSDTAASDFASNMLEGTYTVFKKETDVGYDSGITSARSVTVVGTDQNSGQKTALSFIVKQNKSSDDIENALKGKTYNGVKFDEVVVVKSILLTFGNDGTSNNSQTASGS